MAAEDCRFDEHFVVRPTATGATPVRVRFFVRRSRTCFYHRARRSRSTIDRENDARQGGSAAPRAMLFSIAPGLVRAKALRRRREVAIHLFAVRGEPLIRRISG